MRETVGIEADALPIFLLVLSNLGQSEGAHGDPKPRAGGKIKFHILGYRMTLPDTGKQAELVLATSDSPEANIQATISFVIPPDGAGNASE